jgi:hypothetical protein
MIVGAALAFLVFLAAAAEGKASIARDWQIVALVASVAFAIGLIGTNLAVWLLADRRRVVLVGILLFAAMGLCPPWVYTFSPTGAATTTKPAGYHFIFYGPAPERPRQNFGVRIDLTRLAIQWIILSIIIGGLFAVAASEAKTGRKRREGGLAR